MPRYVRFVAENNGRTCDKCRCHHGKIYETTDPRRPTLPIHPNCRCKYQDIPITQESIKLQEEKQRTASVLINKHHISGEQAEELAEQIIIARMGHQTLNSEKVFLLFNGRYLLSSDGEIMFDAVSGVATNMKSSTQNFTTGKCLVETRSFDYSYERQGLKDFGGIPTGLYYILSSEERSFEKMKATHITSPGGWGLFSWSLHPSKDTDTRGRSGFFIHGGRVFGSKGCIDLRDHEILFRNYLQAENIKKIYVAVNYPQEVIEITESREENTPNLLLDSYFYPRY